MIEVVSETSSNDSLDCCSCLKRERNVFCEGNKSQLWLWPIYEFLKLLTRTERFQTHRIGSTKIFEMHDAYRTHFESIGF